MTKRDPSSPRDPSGADVFGAPVVSTLVGILETADSFTFRCCSTALKAEVNKHMFACMNGEEDLGARVLRSAHLGRSSAPLSSFRYSPDLTHPQVLWSAIITAASYAFPGVVAGSAALWLWCVRSGTAPAWLPNDIDVWLPAERRWSSAPPRGLRCELCGFREVDEHGRVSNLHKRYARGVRGMLPDGLLRNFVSTVCAGAFGFTQDRGSGSHEPYGDIPARLDVDGYVQGVPMKISLLLAPTEDVAGRFDMTCVQVMVDKGRISWRSKRAREDARNMRTSLTRAGLAKLRGSEPERGRTLRRIEKYEARGYQLRDRSRRDWTEAVP